jgi:hypothetical protein
MSVTLLSIFMLNVNIQGGHYARGHYARGHYTVGSLYCGVIILWGHYTKGVIIQHNDGILQFIMPSDCHYDGRYSTKCHYADCHYVKHCYSKIHHAMRHYIQCHFTHCHSAILLSIIMLCRHVSVLCCLSSCKVLLC